MKILFLEAKESEKTYLPEYLKETDHEFIITSEHLHENNVDKFTDADALCLLNKSFTTPAIINKFNKLKYITTRSTGYDNLDIAFLKSKKIQVSHLPSYSETSVSEHTISLILALSRELKTTIMNTQQGIFNHESITPFEVQGKYLGVIGTGKIGRKVISIAKAFGTNIIAYDAYPNKDFESRLGFRYVDFIDLIKQADIITLHVPYKPGDSPLFNSDTFKLAKSGVKIVNTARGGLIDSKALLEALNCGKVSGAALDVLQYEKNIRTETPHPNVKYDIALMKHPKCLVTPHSAYKSYESIHRSLKISVENIEKFFEGKPQNLL